MVWKALTNGIVGDEAHHSSRDEKVEDRTGRSSEDGCSTDVAARVLDLRGGDRCAFDTDERKEGHPGGDADPAVEASSGCVERSEVRRLDVEPTDDTDNDQWQELEHDRDVLEPRHLPNADEVDRCGYPQTGQSDAEVGPRGWVRDAEQ
jgi:hypothetical protein